MVEITDEAAAELVEKIYLQNQIIELLTKQVKKLEASVKLQEAMIQNLRATISMLRGVLQWNPSPNPKPAN